MEKFIGGVKGVVKMGTVLAYLTSNLQAGKVNDILECPTGNMKVGKDCFKTIPTILDDIIVINPGDKLEKSKEAPKIIDLEDKEIYTFENITIETLTGSTYGYGEVKITGLPAGLSYDKFSGEITGTTNEIGDFNIEVEFGNKTDRFTLNVVEEVLETKDDITETYSDTPTTINVLGNDTNGLQIVNTTTPDYGTVEIVDNKIKYTPQEGTFGEVNFYYIVKKGEDYSAAKVIVTVKERPDTIAPLITLNGDLEITLTVGDAYTEYGANVTDNKNTGLTASIEYFNSNDKPVSKEEITEKAGTYTVKYNVSDAAGNAATEVSRTVNVEEENEAPVINTTVSTVDGHTVDTKDPYKVGADYTIDASRDLIIDTTGSTDDGTIDNLKITSDLAGEIHNGDLEAVQIPRQSSGTDEILTIILTDNEGETTTITKKVAR